MALLQNHLKATTSLLKQARVAIYCFPTSQTQTKSNTERQQLFSLFSSAAVARQRGVVTSTCKHTSTILCSQSIFTLPKHLLARAPLTQFNNNITRNIHSKSEGDQQFIEFLTDEIKAERDDSAQTPLASITDFKLESEGPKVKLTKKHGTEKVTVEFNINDSVDSDAHIADSEDEIAGDMESPEMLSRPEFDVVIQKDGINSKLCFTCHLIDPSRGAPEDEQDLFAIAELAVIEGEWTDDTYTASADLLDANMYDMLMLMLDDRGITKEFCSQLVQFSTAYEHTSYVNMLESVQKFMQK